jgi:hypothetical protein
MPTADRYLQFRGKVQERLNWQHWKCCEPQKGSVGSNPTLSATVKIRIKDEGKRKRKGPVQKLGETGYWLKLIQY